MLNHLKTMYTEKRRSGGYPKLGKSVDSDQDT